MKCYVTFLKFNFESRVEIIKLMNDDIVNKKKSFVVTPNLDFLRLSYNDIFFRNIINNAEYSLADGKPIIWLAKKEKKNIEKISGSDIVFDILELANENNYSIFLFGGKPGVSSMAANNIKKKYPNITLIYDYSPVFGYEKEISEIDKCIDYINRKKPDIVFLCTGTPKTEKFFGYFQ